MALSFGHASSSYMDYFVGNLARSPLYYQRCLIIEFIVHASDFSSRLWTALWRITRLGKMIHALALTV